MPSIDVGHLFFAVGMLVGAGALRFFGWGAPKAVPGDALRHLCTGTRAGDCARGRRGRK